MEKSEWSTASLTISSDVLNCWEITEALNIQPSSCVNKGELISQRNPNSKKRTNTVWILESNLDKAERLEEHITTLVNFANQNSTILKQISAQATISIFCGYCPNNSQGSFLLSSDLLKKLSLVDLELIFDLYCPELDSEDEVQVSQT